MNWTDLINNSNLILAGISAFLGGGWIVTLYNAKPKKKSIEIDNLKDVITQQGETLKLRQEDSKAYRREVKKEMKSMNDRINRLNVKLDAQRKAIFSAYQCKFKDNDHDCIVLTTFNNCEECILDRENEENNEVEEK